MALKENLSLAGKPRETFAKKSGRIFGGGVYEFVGRATQRLLDRHRVDGYWFVEPFYPDLVFRFCIDCVFYLIIGGTGD